MVLDLAFDVVLGLPWLVVANPHLDCAQWPLLVKLKDRWVPLPTVAL